MPSIEQYYENYWEDPESYSDPTTPQRQSLLARVLPRVPPGGLILDVGCGRGEFCDFFARQGFRAEGTDLSHAAVKYARERYPAATFHAALVEDLLPARAGEFDAVFSSEVIEHLFDVGTYLLAINHLLRDGGLFILTTPYHGLLKNITIDLLNYSNHYDPLGQHIRFFDTKSMDKCLRTFGFEVVHWWGYGRPWPFWKSFFVVARKISLAKALSVGTQGRSS
jgi:SAM-dependent methyltransferase